MKVILEQNRIDQSQMKTYEVTDKADHYFVGLDVKKLAEYVKSKDQISEFIKVFCMQKNIRAFILNVLKLSRITQFDNFDFLSVRDTDDLQLDILLTLYRFGIIRSDFEYTNEFSRSFLHTIEFEKHYDLKPYGLLITLACAFTDALYFRQLYDFLNLKESIERILQLHKSAFNEATFSSALAGSIHLIANGAKFETKLENRRADILFVDENKKVYCILN